MNRKDEYWALISELKEEPAALETSVQRSVRRAKRQPWKKPLGALGSLAGICAAFVLMVNTSPAFAVSCGEIPILKGLAAAVAWSPSLRSAIEHDYIQYVSQSQTVDGVTVTLEYVIADAQQMVVFYHVNAPVGEDDLWHSMTCDLKNTDGTPVMEYSVSSGSALEDLNSFSIHFNNSPPPQDLILEAQLRFTNDSGESGTPRNYTFTLHLNPKKIAEKVILPVNQWVELDGQRLLVERLELTPTKTALYLDDDSANTAWLRSLDFYFTDGKGRRYDKKDSAVSAMGREESEGFYTYYHQSLYFLDDPDGLTLHITEADWLDKDNHTVQIDLTTGQADWLPEYILDIEVREENYVPDGLQKTLYISSASSRMCLDYTYYDPEGGEHRFNGGGLRQGYIDDQGVSHPSRFYYMLKDYPFDQVTVELAYTHVSQPSSPIEIPIP